MQKRALAVHDISCVGRCSLTVALPALSAAGVNTAVIPTALLSTHTGEFQGYTHFDLSDQLRPITDHLSTLGLHYDAFYSGYLASGAQVEQILYMLDHLTDDKTHIFVDPAFADHGRRYSLIDEDMPRQMRRLIARADTIVPNVTEAAFLLDLPWAGESHDPETVREYCRRLIDLGPKNVIVTDVSLPTQPDKTGVAILTRDMQEAEFLFGTRYEGLFHGTGDVFASFMLAALMKDLSPVEAARLSLDMTHEAIRLTLEDGEPLRYGLQFERVLHRLYGLS